MCLSESGWESGGRESGDTGGGKLTLVVEMVL